MQKPSLLTRFLTNSRVSRETTLLEIRRLVLAGLNAEQIAEKFGVSRARFQQMINENRDLAVIMADARAEARRSGAKLTGARKRPMLRPACGTCGGTTYCKICDGWRRRVSDGQPCDCDNGQCRDCDGTGYAPEDE